MNCIARLEQVYNFAQGSLDPSTQNAALIIPDERHHLGIAIGINNPTHGFLMSEADWDRPRKYALVEHAERNAIYNAAKLGRPTQGATMVAAWAACADCARAIVQSGIHRLVRHVRPSGHWNESIAIGDEILRAGGVDIVDIVGPLPRAATIKFNGVSWDPSLKESYV